MHRQTEHTQFGWITVTCGDGAVTGLEFSLDGAPDDAGANDVSRETWRQIRLYCEGKLRRFDLPLAPPVSERLGRWLDALARVPFGETVTYKELARRGDMPQAPRAAGSACARNPIPLIIPCHRVTRHDGSLGNFGALRALSPKDPRNLGLKDALIRHESLMRAA